MLSRIYPIPYGASDLIGTAITRGPVNVMLYELDAAKLVTMENPL